MAHKRPVPPGTKYCARCETIKPLDAFYRSKTGGYCKLCQKNYHLEMRGPVGADSALRRKEDYKWRKRHDAKVCTACEKHGSDVVIFRKLGNTRCSACMGKSLWRCPVHGMMRKPRCEKCRYQKIKARNIDLTARRKRSLASQIFLMTGDGLCGHCGVRVRIGKQVDRSHRCAKV